MSVPAFRFLSVAGLWVHLVLFPKTFSGTLFYNLQKHHSQKHSENTLTLSWSFSNDAPSSTLLVTHFKIVTSLIGHQMLYRQLQLSSFGFILFDTPVEMNEDLSYFTESFIVKNPEELQVGLEIVQQSFHDISVLSSHIIVAE